MTPRLPPAWPEQVSPPGSPDWERTALAWLYDQCPPDYRAYDVLRKYPQLLARFAATNLDGAIQAAEAGLRTVRADFAPVLPAEAVEAAVSAYERERHRLRRARHAVDLIDAALRGQTYVPRL